MALRLLGGCCTRQAQELLPFAIHAGYAPQRLRSPVLTEFTFPRTSQFQRDGQCFWHWCIFFAHAHQGFALSQGGAAETNYSPSPRKSRLFLSKLCAAQRGGHTRQRPQPFQNGSSTRKGKRSEGWLSDPAASLSPPAHSSLGTAPATQQFLSPRSRHYKAPFSLDPRTPQRKAIHRSLCTTALPLPADEMETPLKAPGEQSNTDLPRSALRNTRVPLHVTRHPMGAEGHAMPGAR